jgi:hypothetical protein
VVEAAEAVQIDPAALAILADRLSAERVVRPSWRVAPHWWDDSPRTAQYVFVLDALNFCFWGDPKWRIDYQGEQLDGYWALAACLRRAIEAELPLLDANWLAQADRAATARLLAGQPEPPLLDERASSLRQLGQLLLDRYDGQAANLVQSCQGRAVELVRRVAAELPSFDDVATYRGSTVRFYKRAQILCSDLFGAYDGQDLGAFTDLTCLTAFADYKLPQVLRDYGVMSYTPALAERVDRLEELPAGSPEEVEIRAATIWSVELLRRALADRGTPLLAFEVDWLLWTISQAAGWQHPYHRTRTVFY